MPRIIASARDGTHGTDRRFSTWIQWTNKTASGFRIDMDTIHLNRLQLMSQPPPQADKIPMRALVAYPTHAGRGMAGNGSILPPTVAQSRHHLMRSKRSHGKRAIKPNRHIDRENIGTQDRPRMDRDIQQASFSSLRQSDIGPAGLP